MVEATSDLTECDVAFHYAYLCFILLLRFQLGE